MLLHINNKLEIFEDALFQCSETSTHKMQKMAHWKISVRKTENGKSHNWVIFEKLALNHVHIDLPFPLFIFLYSSTLWYDIASPYHRSDLRLDLTPQMIKIINWDDWIRIKYIFIWSDTGLDLTPQIADLISKWLNTEKQFGNFQQFWVFCPFGPFWHFWHNRHFWPFWPIWNFWAFW